MRDLVITRLLDAPLELVWKAWTDPRHVMRWWGPDHFSSPSCIMDFREGGVTRVAMRAPQEMGGGDTFSTWTYTRIVPLQRIEYIQNLADRDGNRIDPSEAGLPPDFPQDVRTVITFKAVGDQTELTITEYGMPGADTQMGKFAEIGLNQSLDKLAASIAQA
jgi:uncharacterized protein YndB with AHSA1/START domain